MSARFTIGRLGAQGDGIAAAEGGEVFIPFTLPGETVTAARQKDRATLMSVLEASPLRIDAACRHFTECGGCALQHFEAEAYRQWKREKVVHALKAKGIACEVADLVPCAPHTRRRVVFSARRTEAGMLLGFMRALSSEIIPIEECPISLWVIVAALDRLRRLADLVCAAPKAFHMTVTVTASGLDIAVQDSGKLGENQRRIASNFVMAEGLARLSVDGEVIVEPKKPVVQFGSVAVAVPPGAFLQATEAAEQAMASLVGQHLSRAKKVADLFAGCGSFALRLAAKSEVHAVEGDAPALAALDHAFRFASGLKRVTSERRDLFRRPLTFKELNGFDGLVFDPPRAGAEDQSKQIARSEVPLVAAVSCNPVTLARDLRILLDGGYTLKSVTPIDQFLWSPHVEAVALLEKPRRRR
ncbi:class I SAM-dependent RNA methyltransferase [Mesorhizobium sp. M1C.F.Ca.ET.193.01.1.1]|uniref:class I SAM-dependent RNA methyltransferase n=1 Tax=unclassified Mesorhizobium TaxID=325217 RepID=UPI000FD1BF4B|nr:MULTISPECIES: class I SAM-dependent RNA methyltransferase [unclassified Mesorhizobium]TGS97202.1 class I SAM-dependent RNA methyltransferase [bacterium M00.F.Ca.ET.177.01.1.1]TGQ52361.1 class I SAM-dependent RNA methyltransferase [Mesorhizobium sp. M1C.F.Ca.ET.210.01.1.1]TGQ68991.1 class I SAM-dependent RNA methyltransferase [Mesorhizobium sp. M1C.F.Ca.ET.212.01.1.1]TGR04544.1 class I SAM-dependent RNA methyltransferase [Mesorhizobium sp. M1C.F.Ca.ET.204.01.1.1]TGR25311.1 class I SAM-depend